MDDHEPDLHAAQEVAPIREDHVPATQFEHVTAPRTVDQVPGGQPLQRFNEATPVIVE